MIRWDVTETKIICNYNLLLLVWLKKMIRVCRNIYLDVKQHPVFSFPDILPCLLA